MRGLPVLPGTPGRGRAVRRPWFVSSTEPAGASEDARGIFQARAEILEGLEHPTSPGKSRLAVSPDGRPFVVSEYLDGEDLATHVRRAGEHPTPMSWLGGACSRS